jgi:molecular chaperone DnaK (HSP70)
MIECRQCGQWKIKSSDDYCGYCGFLQLPIVVEPLELTLISELANEGKIVFSNNGTKDLDIEILPLNHSLDVLNFLPSNSFTLVNEDSTEIKISLDADKLPRDLIFKELKYVCMINRDQRKTIDLSIQLKSGPNPRALIDEIRFGDVEEGKDVENWTEIVNKGGVPLHLKSLKIEGSSQFQVRLKHSLQALEPNEKAKIPVVWKSPKFDPDLDKDKLGVRIQFKNSSKELFIPIRGNLFKFQFEAVPSNINISQALAKQNYSKEISLKNNGTKDIEVTAIESDSPWLQVVTKANSFTLLCLDSVARNAAIGPTVFAERFKFEAVLSPNDLEKGIHKGKVKVLTTKSDSYIEIGIQMDVIKPVKCDEYIGIDFGTSNSVVAIWDDEKSDITLINEENMTTKVATPLIPSVLVFSGSPDNYKIGAAAENEAKAYPEVTVRSIKRIMGYGNDRDFFGRNFSPEELASKIIKKLVEYAEEGLFRIHEGHKDAYRNINKAIVTVPANFYDLQIRGILKACEDAGIDIEEKQARQAAMEAKKDNGRDINAGIILDEPSAAALFYLSKFQEEEKEEFKKFKTEIDERIAKNEMVHLLIYDHGGGTLDVSVVQIGRMENKNNSIGVKVLANKGDNKIGGDSIDIVIMKELLKICKNQDDKFLHFDDTLISDNFDNLEKRRVKENWNRELWKGVLSARSKWKNASERLKIALDDLEDKEFSFNKNGYDIFSIKKGKIEYIEEEFKTTVTVVGLNKWIQKKIILKSQNLVRDALLLNKIGVDKIDYIIHTGRSSLMPMLRENVKKVFPKLKAEYDRLDKEYLKVCVAKGAVIYGMLRGGIVKDRHVQLMSGGRRLPHAYGVQVMRGFAPYFESIIDIGREYPTVVEKEYKENEIPRNGILTLKFLKNSGKENKIKGNPDIRKIGALTFDTLEDKKPGCDVKFIIDANRKIEVTADGKTVEIEPVRLEEQNRWVG